MQNHIHICQVILATVDMQVGSLLSILRFLGNLLEISMRPIGRNKARNTMSIAEHIRTICILNVLEGI